MLEIKTKTVKTNVRKPIVPIVLKRMLLRKLSIVLVRPELAPAVKFLKRKVLNSRLSFLTSATACKIEIPTASAGTKAKVNV